MNKQASVPAFITPTSINKKKTCGSKCIKKETDLNALAFRLEQLVFFPKKLQIIYRKTAWLGYGIKLIGEVSQWN